MKVVVIGGGLAGLAAATWLNEVGHNVIVLEKEPTAGGRAHTICKSGTRDIVDVGTQYFHSNYKRALKLIKDVGLEKELHKIKGKTRFFDSRLDNGSFLTGHRLPYIATGSIYQNIKLILTGLLRMVCNLINPYKVLHKSRIDHLALSDVITDPFEWEYTARSLVAVGALIEPDKEEISYLHLVRLMRIILMTDYLSLNNGIASLHERLAKKLNVQYGTGVSVLEEKDGKVSACITATGERIDADHFIVATTPHQAGEILPQDWVKERKFLSSIIQPTAMTVTLFLSEPLEIGVWSYMFRPDANKFISFCVDAAQKNPNMAPSGNAVLQAWICHPAAERLANASDRDVVNQVISELETNFPRLQKMVEETHVHRVIQAIPQMTVSHNARAQTFLRNAERHSNLDFCGDYLSGGYMECALWSAERAVKRISKLSDGFL